jgi:hypothetical protein
MEEGLGEVDWLVGKIIRCLKVAFNDPLAIPDSLQLSM